MKDGLEHPIAVLGMPVSSLTVSEAADTLERLILSGGTQQACVMNLDTWMNALADPHLQRIVAGSSLVLPDSMLLVWISGLLGFPLAERITGVDLVPRLAELSARKGYKLFLLGAKPGVATRVARMLEQSFPSVEIVGSFTPVEENLIRMDHAEILRQIHATSPDILLVAFGNPNQEKWIWMHRKRLGVPLTMGVGSSFDVLLGDIRRAPHWVQRCGLEWAMCLAQEPMRLGRRYLRDFACLARRLPVALLAAWFQKPYHGPSSVTTVTTPQALHVRVSGRFGAEVAADIQRATTASIMNGLAMVVHLHAVKQLTAPGLGMLLSARRQMLEAGLSLALARPDLKVRFVLYAWNLRALFDEWQPAYSRGRPPFADTKAPVQIA